jgi:hypothetical protein
MSIYSEDYYNPCIRKGKHKPIYKKQKKYEAKVQKTNLIRPKRVKLISNNWDSIINNNKGVFDNMVKILMTENEQDWNDEYEFLYIYTFHRIIDDELEEKYTKIKLAIYENEQYDKYNDYYDDYEDEYERYRDMCRFWR